jgi:enoyl reductase-like protein
MVYLNFLSAVFQQKPVPFIPILDHSFQVWVQDAVLFIMLEVEADLIR